MRYSTNLTGDPQSTRYEEKYINNCFNNKSLASFLVDLAIYWDSGSTGMDWDGLWMV